MLGPPWKFVSSPRRDASILKRDFYASWNIQRRISRHQHLERLPRSPLGSLVIRSVRHLDGCNYCNNRVNELRGEIKSGIWYYPIYIYNLYIYIYKCMYTLADETFYLCIVFFWRAGFLICTFDLFTFVIFDEFLRIFRHAHACAHLRTTNTHTRTRAHSRAHTDTLSSRKKCSHDT